MNTNTWDGPTGEYDMTALAAVAALRHSPAEAQAELARRHALGHTEGCQCQCPLGRTVADITGGIGCRELRQIAGRRHAET